jgi:hypothetical protein
MAEVCLARKSTWIHAARHSSFQAALTWLDRIVTVVGTTHYGESCRAFA